MASVCARVLAEASGLGEGSALALGEAVPDVETVGSAPDEVVLRTTELFVVLGVELCVALVLGVGLFVLSLPLGLALFEAVALAVGVAVVLGEGVGVLVGDALAVGVALLVGVGLFVGVALLVGLGLLLIVGAGFDGDGVGEGDLRDVNCSHCWVVPLTTVAVGVGVTPVGTLDCAADAATVNPAAAATTTPLVRRPTPTGRTCAKRMKTLPVLFVAAAERPIQYEVAASGLNARLVRYVHHWTPSLPLGAT